MLEYIKASEFKAKCLELMDKVAAQGDTLIITKRGHPVAQLTPARHAPKKLRGALKNSFRIHGDILSPIAPEWEKQALSKHDRLTDS